MNYIFFCIGAGLLLGVIGFLWLFNESRDDRYKQRFLPVLAFVLGFAGVLVYWYFPLQIEEYVLFCVHWAEEHLDRDLSALNSYPVLLYNFALLVLLLGIKSGHRSLSLIIRIFVFVTKWIPGVKKLCSWVTKSTLLFPAFGAGNGGTVFIHDGWVYPGKFFRMLSTLYVLALLFFLWCLAYDNHLFIELKYIQLPVIPLLFFLEAGWYLLGKSEDAVRSTVIGGEGIGSGEQGCYDQLWQTYNDLCPGRLLSSDSRIQYNSNGLVESPSEGAVGHQEVDQLLDTVVKNLARNNKEGLSVNQKKAILYAFNDKDIHLIEPVFCQAAAVVFSVLQRDCLLGKNILILLPANAGSEGRREAEQWLSRGFAEIYFKGIMPAVDTKGEFETKQVVMITLSELLSARDVSQWMESLARVVVLDTSQVFYSNVYQAEMCCNFLADKCQTLPGYMLLSTTDYANREWAFRDLTGLSPEEIVLHRKKDQLRHAFCLWEAEGNPRFQDVVLQHQRGRDYGNIVPLLKPAVDDRITDVTFFGLNSRAFKESLEEFDQEEGLLAINLNEIVNYSFFTAVSECISRGVVIGRDSSCNLVETLKSGIHLCLKDTLFLGVSPEYMLRDYFADSLEFFLQSDALTSWMVSTRKLKTKYTIAVALCARLQNGFLHEQKIIDDYLNRIPGERGKQNISVKGRLVELFQDIFDLDIRGQRLLDEESDYEWFQTTGKFEKILKFRLSASARDTFDSFLYRYFTLKDGGDILGQIPYDLLYQNYLPGQIHGVSGKPYEVESIDIESRSVHMRSMKEINTAAGYTHVNKISIFPGSESILTKLTVNGQNRCRGIDPIIHVGEREFTVTTLGYHEVTDTWNNSKYVTLDEEIIKEYRYGRCLNLTFKLSSENKKLFSGIGPTLAVLFQQIMCTVFPETYRSLCVTSDGMEDCRDRREDWTKSCDPINLLPALEGCEDGVADSPTIYFFEDAQFDLGMVQSLADNWFLLLEIIDDYLYWVLDEVGPKFNQDRKEKFLKFGDVALNENLKVHQVKQFFALLFQDKSRTLKKYRKRQIGKAVASEIQPVMRRCDFCAGVISESSFDRLDDGRERCAECKTSSVNEMEDLVRTYKEGREALTGDYKLTTLSKDITVNFADAETIAEETGDTFQPTSGFDPRAIGFARRTKDRTEVYIENGQPYHLVFATIIHELTHIWQYDHLQMKEIRKHDGLITIEGHAKWVEISCLERRGMAPGFCAAEKQRSDEYGEGYRKIERMVSASVEKDPFKLLVDSYGTKNTEGA